MSGEAVPCWHYTQSTGVLTDPNGEYAGTGYAGHGEGLDNPAEQGEANIGPVPEGKYTIGSAFIHPKCGPISMRLSPFSENEMFGRGGFLIHGDTASMNHTASDGCIILGRPIREAIAASPIRLLVVTSGKG